MRRQLRRSPSIWDGPCRPAAPDALVSAFPFASFSFYQFESHTPRAGFLVPVVADNLELAYFGSVGDVSANAGAEVVVTDADQPESLAGVVGQLAEVHLGRHLVAAHKLIRNIQMTLYLLLFIMSV